MATKRGNGEGSAAYKRKDGRWCARYTVYTPTGPKRKPVYGRTRAEPPRSWPRPWPTGRVPALRSTPRTSLSVGI